MQRKQWAKKPLKVPSLQRNYSSSQNFQLPCSKNGYALYVLLEHYFVDRFFLSFLYSCISYQGQQGIQFPCNSFQDLLIHPGTRTENALTVEWECRQTNKCMCWKVTAGKFYNTVQIVWCEMIRFSYMSPYVHTITGMWILSNILKRLHFDSLRTNICSL